MARLACVVQPTPTGVSVTWSDGPAAFAPYELPARPLAAAADAARAALGAVVEGSFTDDAGDGPAAAAALATAGYGLYQALFKPPAEQMALASEVRNWLDTLQAEGAVEGLEIVAEGGAAVPWNLVYDRRPDPAAFRTGGDDPARWRPFWGLRYDLSGGRRVSPLRRLPVLHNPRVVVVTDPLVLDRLPTESRELAALCQEHGWAQARTRQELADALQAGRPDLLYWLGHTQADPFGLVLGDDAITPDDLKAMLEGDPFADAGSVFGGVAFLNACGTAVAEKTGSFLDALHPLGLTGYVATEHVTVDTFAAPLGREFLTAFAVRGEPLGKVMRQLRGQVPLGLLYGSYCPSAVHVRHEPRAQPADAAPIVMTRAGVGTKLRRDPNQPQAEAYPLPPQPYRSLQAYGPADRALFAGRDDDTLRFAQLLDEPGTRLVILHGESGVGKTSFLRAGVVPFLERECVGYRFARDRSRGDGETVLLVRATNDPVAQIAAALTTFCASPLTHRTPAGADAAADLPGVLRAAVGDRAGRDALRDALRADPGLLGRLLADLGRVLPFTPVLVIDQAEEVFTLARTPADEENRALALEMLRRAAGGPGGFKVVVSLRTEYHGRLTDKLRTGTHVAGGTRDYLLTDFGRAELAEVILRPTSPTPIAYAAEIPAEKYRFRFAAGVADEIARRARAHTRSRQDSALPLVQVVCAQLYERVRGRPGRTVAPADLAAIGGVEGGLRAHTEALLAHLFPARADREAFRRLLAGPESQMFVRQPDGTLTTALVPADFLARHWTGRTPFEAALRVAADGDWRLLRVNSLRIGGDEAERPYVSLGHDALAGVVAGWADDLRRRAQARRFRLAIAGLVVGLVGLGAVAAGLTGLTWWAITQRREAEQARDRAERERYLTTVRSAAAAWDAKRHDEAAALLDAYHPAVNPGAHARGYVGFEWNHLWRRTGLAAPLMRGHVGTAEIALDPAGTRLAACGEDDVVRVWDAHTGRLVWRREGKLDFPRSLSFSPDGRRLAGGDLTRPGQGAVMLGGAVEVRDGTVVWDAADGEELSLADGGRFDWFPRAGGSGPELRCPDGTRVYRSLPDGTVRVSDAGAADPVSSVAVGDGRAGAVSPDRERVVLLAGAEARVVEAATGHLRHTLRGHTGPVVSAGFSADGGRVLTVGDDRTVRVWDARSGEPLGRIDAAAGDGEVIASTAFRPDGRVVATLTRAGRGDSQGQVRVWDVGTGKEVCAPGGRESVGDRLAFTADGTGLVTYNAAGVDLWDATTGARRESLLSAFSNGEAATIRSAAFDADRSRLLVVDSRTTWVLDAARRSVVRKWPVRAGAGAAFSPDGTRVVAFAWPDRRGDVPSPAAVHVCEMDGGGVFVFPRQLAAGFAAEVSPDGSRLLTTCPEGVRLWDLRSGTELLALAAGPDATAWFSADGHRVYAVVGGRLRTWDGRPVGR